MDLFSVKSILPAAVALLLCSCMETPKPSSTALPPSEQNAIGMDNDIYGLYNVNTVKTISGKILEVNQVRMGNYGERLDMLLQYPEGKILVHLGPPDFVRKSGIELKKGDGIIVKGSETTFNRSVRMIASELISGKHEYRLRDKRGMPLWQESGKDLLKDPPLKLAE